VSVGVSTRSRVQVVSAGITLAPAAFVGALLCLAAVGIVTVVLGGSYLGYLLFTEAKRRL
jgi:iron complex transport system permease protein